MKKQKLKIIDLRIAKLGCEVSAQALEVFRICSRLDAERTSYLTWLRSRSESYKGPIKPFITSKRIECSRSFEYRLPLFEYVALFEVYALEVCGDASDVTFGIANFLNFVINSIHLPDPDGQNIRRLETIYCRLRHLLQNRRYLNKNTIMNLIIPCEDLELGENISEARLLNAAAH